MRNMVSGIKKWCGKVFCRMGWHNVPNYHLFSERKQTGFGDIALVHRKAGECVRCHTYIVSTKTTRGLW
jgi:hypothetical protein